MSTQDDSLPSETPQHGKPDAVPVGTGELVRPLSREEELILKIGELMLHVGFVSSAIDTLNRGARRATKETMNVLKWDLLELIERKEAMDAIQWPNAASETRRAFPEQRDKR